MFHEILLHSLLEDVKFFAASSSAGFSEFCDICARLFRSGRKLYCHAVNFRVPFITFSLSYCHWMSKNYALSHPYLLNYSFCVVLMWTECGALVLLIHIKYHTHTLLMTLKFHTINSHKFSSPHK